jgi:hypothetical protein
MRALVLKAAATLLTMAATVASALFVTAHLKNPSAPLQPPVVNAGAAGTSASALGGTLSVGPSVQASNQEPMTSTYAS